MQKLILITLAVFAPFFAFAGEISVIDIATYSLTGKDGQPSGMQMRLSRPNGKWVMEGKEKESTAPWKNLSCDTGCEYRASTNSEQEAYLASFPGDMPRLFDIACIQNTASAFCRLTKKNDASTGGYTLIALVTGKPVPMSLQRLTSPYPTKKSQAQTPVSSCSVTVLQDGTEVQSREYGRVRFYELKGAPFRLEVPSTQCSPSVGVFLSPQDFQYVADSPLVAITTGFSMAGGSDIKDVLFLRSENPRLISGYEGIFDSVKNEYEALCTEFGKCPLKIRAYRTYWNFVGDREGTTTTYADFKRLTTEKPIQGYRGDISVVVYTKVKDAAGGDLSAMETHPIVLRFK